MVTFVMKSKLKEAGEKGTEAEMKVTQWLRKRGYHIRYWHEGKKSNLPYDILAIKGNERWIIDVKTGNKPSVNISNIEKILNDRKLKRYNKIGLALVSDKYPWPYLFEYKKMSQDGFKASLTKKRSAAGRKAAETRKSKKNYKP